MVRFAAWLIVCGSSVACAERAGLPTEGLVAAWSAGGDARDSAADSHGQPRSVKYTSDRTGNARSAFDFDGRSGYVRVPDSDALDTDDAFTVAAWVRPRAYADRDGHESIIVAKYDHHLVQKGDYLLMLRSGGVFHFAVCCFDEKWVGDSLNAESPVPKGEWTHLAATFDEGEMRVYVNGRLEATKLSAKVRHTSRKEYPHDDVYIGALWMNKHNFNGGIDEVAIWNRALPARQVRQACDAPCAPPARAIPVKPGVKGELPRAGLVAFWPGEGSRRDAVGANHAKTYESVGYCRDRHRHPKGAFEFDGRTGFLIVPDRPELDTDRAFTLTAWIKPRAYVDETGLRCNIVVKWFSSPIRGDYGLALNARGALRLTVSHSDRKFVADSIESETVIPKNRWTHVAATFDAGRMKLYIRGRLEAEKTSKTVTRTNRTEYARDDVTIGGLWNDCYNFDGAIDEVGIWSRALSPDEVRRVRDVSAAAPRPAKARLPKKGLVAHWAGDGDTASRTGRHHGKGVDLAYTADRHGRAGRAFAFNGKKGFIRIPDSDELDTDEAFTVAAWIAPQAYQDVFDFPGMIVAKSGNMARSGDFILGFWLGGRVRLTVAGDGDSHAQDRLLSTRRVPLGKWTHVAATFDRGRMRLYLDGKLDGSKASATVRCTDRREYEHDDVIIGATCNDRHSFHGGIDDVAIWNRPLSAEEVRGLCGN